MPLAALSLPEELVEGLNELDCQRRYPKRNELIRVAIRDFLKREGQWV